MKTEEPRALTKTPIYARACVCLSTVVSAEGTRSLSLLPSVSYQHLFGCFFFFVFFFGGGKRGGGGGGGSTDFCFGYITSRRGIICALLPSF